MANFLNITLDTTGPTGQSVAFDAGSYVNQQIADLTLDASGGDVAQMKIWGDVDETYDAQIQDDEGSSSWITYATAKQIKLSAGDGAKNIYAKFRDDVYNQSGQASDSITLDESLPAVSIQSGPSPAKISKVATKDESVFSWQADVAFDEYVVMVVSSSGDAKAAGVQIGTGNGSTNVAGAAGAYPATTNISTTINGADLEAASGGDGSKIVKVFVREHAEDDIWSA
jgi:hypothetical protein